MWEKVGSQEYYQVFYADWERKDFGAAGGEEGN